eukprot:evm.model.scf_724.3 EVM.evm.TU.scf_724.3   scf_724:27957-30520(+)
MASSRDTESSSWYRLYRRAADRHGREAIVTAGATCSNVLELLERQLAKETVNTLHHVTEDVRKVIPRLVKSQESIVEINKGLKLCKVQLEESREEISGILQTGRSVVDDMIQSIKKSNRVVSKMRS